MDDQGCAILLYYKYLDLQEHQDSVAAWYKCVCEQLSLRGRVRVAVDGINVTLGGQTAALQKHVRAVKEHEEIRGGDIDFKLAEWQGASTPVAQETGFANLAVSTCKVVPSSAPLSALPVLRAEQAIYRLWQEVVSIGSAALPPALLAEQAAPHLSPGEWHMMMEDAARGGKSDLCLLDVRNKYETRVGRMHAVRPASVLHCVDEVFFRLGNDEAFAFELLTEEGPVAVVCCVIRALFAIRPKAPYKYDKSCVECLHLQDGLRHMDPGLRCFSDLPGWLAEHRHELAGHRVAMYCTGALSSQLIIPIMYLGAL